MVRIILGIRKNHHVNMKDLRNKIRIMSVNQMCVYHTILEAHNIMKNVSLEQNKSKWTFKEENKHFLRNKTENGLKIPEKPLKNCTGFTYSASKLYNMLPSNLKENNLNTDKFKLLIKDRVWKDIQSF